MLNVEPVGRAVHGLCHIETCPDLSNSDDEQETTGEDAWVWGLGRNWLRRVTIRQLL